MVKQLLRGAGGNVSTGGRFEDKPPVSPCHSKASITPTTLSAPPGLSLMLRLHESPTPAVWWSEEADTPHNVTQVLLRTRHLTRMRLRIKTINNLQT